MFAKLRIVFYSITIKFLFLVSANTVWSILSKCFDVAFLGSKKVLVDIIFKNRLKELHNDGLRTGFLSPAEGSLISIPKTLNDPRYSV